MEVILLWFQKGKNSLSKATELLNISPFRLQKIIADRGIDIHYDVEELQEDIQTLRAKEWL